MEELMEVIKESIQYKAFRNNLTRKIHELDNDFTHLFTIIFTDNIDISIKIAAAEMVQSYFTEYFSDNIDAREGLKMKILQEIVSIEDEDLRDELSCILSEIFTLGNEENLVSDVRDYFNSNDYTNWLRGYFILKSLSEEIFLTFEEDMRKQMKLLLWDSSKISLHIQDCILSFWSDFFFAKYVKCDFDFDLAFWIETFISIIKRSFNGNEDNINEVEMSCKHQATVALQLVTKISDNENKSWIDASRGEEIFLTVLELFDKWKRGLKLDHWLLDRAIEIFLTLMYTESETSDLLKCHISSILKDVMLFYRLFPRHYYYDAFIKTIFNEEPKETVIFLLSVIDSLDAPEKQKASAILIMGDILGNLETKNISIGFHLESFMSCYIFPVERFEDNESRRMIFEFLSDTIELKHVSKNCVTLILDQIMSSITKDPNYEVRYEALRALNTLICSRGNDLKDRINDHMEIIVAELILSIKNLNKLGICNWLVSLIKVIIKDWSAGKDSFVIGFIDMLQDMYCYWLKNKLYDGELFYYIGEMWKYILKEKKVNEAILHSMIKSIYDICLFSTSQSIENFRLCYEEYIIPHFIDDKYIDNILTLHYPEKVLNKFGVHNNSQICQSSSCNLQLIDSKPCNDIDPSTIKLIDKMCSKMTQLANHNEIIDMNITEFFNMILIYHGSAADEFIPQIIDAVGQRLTMEIKCGRLKYCCYSVISTALYVNKELTLPHLLTKRWPSSDECLLDKYIPFLSDGIRIKMNKLDIIGLSAVIFHLTESQSSSEKQIKELIQILYERMETHYKEFLGL